MAAAAAPAPLAPLLARAGVPWYASMLEEAGLCSPGDLRGDADAALALLSDAGVEPRHATAILEALRLEDAAATAAAPPAAPAPQTSVSSHAAVAASGAGCATFTRGGLYCPAFLAAVAPLYEQHMGAENMGPLLYSLVRFTKPPAVLELGAGFTSLFLLQALADNAAELAAASAATASMSAHTMPWLTPAFAASGGAETAAAAAVAASALHVVDNCAHEHTSAHRVASAAAALGIAARLTFHDADALDDALPSLLAPSQRHFGLIWIDLGAAHRLRALVDAWWPRVDPNGGALLVHSTLTNDAGRAWVAHMRRAMQRGAETDADADAAAAAEPGFDYGQFEMLSLLEPHKLLQNSVTMLRRRGGGPGGVPLWDAPRYSKWP